MPKRSNARGVACGMRCPVLLLALLLAACSGPDSPEPVAFRNIAEPATFTGDAACASCHEDQYAGYQAHGMANSFYHLNAETAVEDFPGPWVRDPNGGYEYRAERNGDRFVQVEILRDASGREIHRLEREMRFVMGSGTTARTYFDESQGYLYELPLTWYTQEGRWDFSPGYRVANKRFDRKVPERCMACHNAYPEAVPETGGKYISIPEGISCERCHGPGSLHVSERLAVPEPVSEVDSTIVNPAHLAFERRLDVCQQCHLHTTVSLLKEGQGAFDYRPSHDLSSWVAMFASTEPESDDEIAVISHADRMKQSACFIETLAVGASLECTTCHNPHQGFRTSGPEYFNQTCLTCHQPAELELVAAHDASANCIDCHMPKVESSEAPHSSFTDHKIRVVSTRDERANSLPTERLSELEPDQELVAYRSAGEPAVYQAMAYVVLGRRRGDVPMMLRGADLLDGLAGEEELFGEAHFLRGLARLQTGDARGAVPGLQAATGADGEIPERLNALAQAYEALGQNRATIESLYRRAVTAQPARADIWVNLGRFLEASGRVDDAVDAYREAVRQEPWLPEGAYNLGTALARAGAFDEARAYLLESVALEPRNPQAWGNLGAVYGQMGAPDSSRYAFEQAVELAPRDPVALGNLGAFLLNVAEYDLAIEYLDRAVQEDPGFADALANRALAHLRQGERASARLYAGRALEAAPGHALAGQILQEVN